MSDALALARDGRVCRGSFGSGESGETDFS
jgi:hypothetical protein